MKKDTVVATRGNNGKFRNNGKHSMSFKFIKNAYIIY